MGYPNFDFIRQINMILHLWEQMGRFPISFVPMVNMVDKTDECIDKLNKHTKRIANIFVNLTTTENRMSHALLTFFKSIKIRGILTMLGMRKTNASQECPWPQLLTLK